jgi:hypothetical protein
MDKSKLESIILELGSFNPPYKDYSFNLNVPPRMFPGNGFSFANSNSKEAYPFNVFCYISECGRTDPDAVGLIRRNLLPAEIASTREWAQVLARYPAITVKDSVVTLPEGWVWHDYVPFKWIKLFDNMDNEIYKWSYSKLRYSGELPLEHS